MKLCIMVNSDTHYNILDNELFQQNCFFLKGVIVVLKRNKRKVLGQSSILENREQATETKNLMGHSWLSATIS